MGHDRHPELRARVDLHVLDVHRLPVCSSVRLPLLVVVADRRGASARSCRWRCRSLAFEQIIKRARDKRSAEMQILIGGIGVASDPAGHRAAPHQEQPVRALRVDVRGEGLPTWRPAHHQRRRSTTIVLAVVLWGGIALWLRRPAQRAGAARDRCRRRDRRDDGHRPPPAGPAHHGGAGGLAGLAGVLFTYYLGAITPESGDTLLVKAFAIIILGGVGSMRGVAFGAYRPGRSRRSAC